MTTPTITPSEAAARLGVSERTLRTVARAGIERLTPHSCRHGFATAMLRARNVPLDRPAFVWHDKYQSLRDFARKRLEDAK